LETVGVAALGLGQRLEPVADLVEALVAGRLRHARVHVGVLVRLAGDGGLEIVRRAADRQSGGGIADGLEVLEMAMRVAGLTLGSRTEHGGNVVVTLNVGLRCEIQVPAVGLRFAREGFLQVVFRLAALEI